ncbi:hypothetical protein ACPOL_5141 [Acidisarcina polymorpha]|uniref:Uncharacterized protein n=1 Tax=Acidisarcina polymorpha TaxID=2211140 RepID=A0A2Z5G6V9_9BACT|nr:hypothetical protein ACPOL_5141 [Acidisarcina polymorpha]
MISESNRFGVTAITRVTLASHGFMEQPRVTAQGERERLDQSDYAN